ncbi:hypothetical protein OAO18_08040, partial [Francisellaceae bacterium]|nr:hypothetical protein [Francisellaceae bacterium]
MKTRTFWVWFIIVLLLLLLWIIGPGIAFFSFKPFASIWVRLIITIVIIGYFILKILRQNGLLNIGSWVTSLSQNRKQKKTSSYLPTARSIRREMNTLIAFLARNRKKSQAKESIYEKPWYFVCGTDTSGKEA